MTDNLASFGIATQQPTQGNPSLAIDSDRTAGSCSKPSGSEAWWQDDLGKLSLSKTYTFILVLYLVVGMKGTINTITVRYCGYP